MDQTFCFSRNYERRIVIVFGVLLSLFCAQRAFATQVYRIDPSPVMTVSGNVPFGGLPALYAVANATIQFCQDAACTLPATTYTDATGNTTCPVNAPVTLPATTVCVSASGPQGQFGFWVQPGTYYFKVITPQGVTFGPYAISTPNIPGTALIVPSGLGTPGIFYGTSGLPNVTLLAADTPSGILQMQPVGNGMTSSLHAQVTSGTLPNGTLSEFVTTRTQSQAFGGNYSRVSYSSVGSTGVQNKPPNFDGMFIEAGGTLQSNSQLTIPWLVSIGIENPAGTFTSYEPFRFLVGADTGNTGFGVMSPGVAQRDILQIYAPQLSAAGTSDSNSLKFFGYSFDTVQHAVNWRENVHPTNNGGASTWRLQNRIDNVAFADVWDCFSTGQCMLGSGGGATDIVIASTPFFMTFGSGSGFIASTALTGGSNIGMTVSNVGPIAAITSNKTGAGTIPPIQLNVGVTTVATVGLSGGGGGIAIGAPTGGVPATGSLNLNSLQINGTSILASNGAINGLSFNSLTLCNSTASPAVCGSAPEGSVNIAAATGSIQVNTSIVSAASQIFIQEDSSLGTRLGVTCNTTTGRTYTVTARSAGASFTITASANPTTNPACLSYSVIN